MPFKRATCQCQSTRSYFDHNREIFPTALKAQEEGAEQRQMLRDAYCVVVTIAVATHRFCDSKHVTVMGLGGLLARHHSMESSERVGSSSHILIDAEGGAPDSRCRQAEGLITARSAAICCDAEISAPFRVVVGEVGCAGIDSAKLYRKRTVRDDLRSVKLVPN